MNDQPHVFLFDVPSPPVWKVMLIDGTYWHLAADKKPPNAFHRFMHKLVFGLKWERIEQ